MSLLCLTVVAGVASGLFTQLSEVSSFALGVSDGCKGQVQILGLRGVANFRWAKVG